MSADDALTVRDRFAMAALATITDPSVKAGVEWAHLRAQRAYAVADAMVRISDAINLGERLGAKHGIDMPIAAVIEWFDGDNADNLIEESHDFAGDNGYGPTEDGDERPGTDEFMEAFDRMAREEAFTPRFEVARRATVKRAKEDGAKWAVRWSRETGNNAPSDDIVAEAANDAASVDVERCEADAVHPSETHVPRAYRLAFKNSALQWLRARAKSTTADEGGA